MPIDTSMYQPRASFGEQLGAIAKGFQENQMLSEMRKQRMADLALAQQQHALQLGEARKTAQAHQLMGDLAANHYDPVTGSVDIEGAKDRLAKAGRLDLFMPFIDLARKHAETLHKTEQEKLKLEEEKRKNIGAQVESLHSVMRSASPEQTQDPALMANLINQHASVAGISPEVASQYLKLAGIGVMQPVPGTGAPATEKPVLLPGSPAVTVAPGLVQPAAPRYGSEQMFPAPEPQVGKTLVPAVEPSFGTQAVPDVPPTMEELAAKPGHLDQFRQRVIREGLKPETFLPEMEKVDDGRQLLIYNRDKTTGKLELVSKIDKRLSLEQQQSMKFAAEKQDQWRREQKATNGYDDAYKLGALGKTEEALAALPYEARSVIDMLHRNQLPIGMRGGISANSPANQRILGLWQVIYPKDDVNKMNNAIKVMTNFTTGQPAMEIAHHVTLFNHLEQMRKDMMEAQKNGTLSDNAIKNSITEYLQRNFGALGPYDELTPDQKVVVGETAKILGFNTGGGKDKLAAMLDPKASGKYTLGAIDKLQRLVATRTAALGYMYNASSHGRDPVEDTIFPANLVAHLETIPEGQAALAAWKKKSGQTAPSPEAAALLPLFKGRVKP